MAYDGRLLARARAELDRLREQQQALSQRRRDQVYARLPEVKNIDDQLRRHMAQLVSLTIKGGPGMKTDLDALKDENLKAQERKQQLLERAGYRPDVLDDSYYCPLCRDTGIYQGHVCSCLDRLYNQELTKELGGLLRHGDESFERFDLSLYPSDYDPAIGASPRETMNQVLTACRRYAENFSSASPNLLLQGGTGLGKTYLSACIARAVAAKGLSVCYESAAPALEHYEIAKFSRDLPEGEAASQRCRWMQDCDLMILDDLGTEMVTPMSQSALYTLINSRLVAGKKTLISTNLRDAELEKKYNPQIYSRIAGEFTALPFVGQDIRRSRKGV